MRWGIISTGFIARKFTESLRHVPEADCAAVASRTQNKADRFSREFNIPKAYGNYDELIKSDDVDIIYIGTPHHSHYDIARKCLLNGKHVLCEKAFTMTSRQTEHLIYLSRKHELFLMEAMWMHFLPIHETVQGWLRDGLIGEVRHIFADFGSQPLYDEESRIFNLSLGGGALYDIGIYPLALTTHLLQAKPDKMKAEAIFAPNGADINDSVIMNFDNTIASLSFTFTCNTPNEATISGDKGYIKIHGPFWMGTSATLYVGNETRREELKYDDHGYQFEAQHVEDCLRNGLVESPIMPLSETLLNMMLLEEIAERIGLKYPKDICRL